MPQDDFPLALNKTTKPIIFICTIISKK